jgi:ClpP class serine protease
MFIEPGAWLVLHQLAQAYIAAPASARAMAGAVITLGGGDEDAGDEGADPPKRVSEDDAMREGIAYMYLTGTVAKRVAVDFCAPDTWLDLARVDRALRAAAQDPAVKSILLHIDSPGGYGLGLDVTNRLIGEIAAEKPVYTYTDTLQCSAAIWGFSSATERFAAPDAVVGSIGSYQVLLGYSRQCKEDGIDVTFLRSGDLKGAGHPLKELTVDEIAMFQAELDAHAERFRSTVERDTGLEREWMRGQTFTGEEASEIGLIDMTVDTPEELLAMIAHGGSA